MKKQTVTRLEKHVYECHSHITGLKTYVVYIPAKLIKAYGTKTKTFKTLDEAKEFKQVVMQEAGGTRKGKGLIKHKTTLPKELQPTNRNKLG